MFQDIVLVVLHMSPGMTLNFKNIGLKVMQMNACFHLLFGRNSGFLFNIVAQIGTHSKHSHKTPNSINQRSHRLLFRVSCVELKVTIKIQASIFFS